MLFLAVDLDLNDLLELLDDIAPNWYVFGNMLRVDATQLDKIDNSLTSTVCLSRTLQEWIKCSGRQATLPALVKAVKSPIVSYRTLANDIEHDKELKEVLKIGKPGRKHSRTR